MPVSGSRRSIAALVVAGFAVASLGVGVLPAQAASGSLKLSVLSNRADLISGGDALVEVAVPSGVDPTDVRVAAGGKDVTKSFAVRPNGKFQGLVTGLPVGPSRLRASADGRSDVMTVVNHPNGGPVLSGPQVKPWTCQETAVDKQCNQPVKLEYLYKSRTPGTTGFKPYDPASPPSDVATTKTDHGESVPFVIRVETGYQDRDQYRVATLFQPGKSWKPWAAQRQWNGKLLITHGGGCGNTYAAGSAPDVLADPAHIALARGFAVMSTALNNTGHRCNVPIAAESMMMAKEHIVETYGPIRYTIGAGCSGGSIAQQTVANAYPGIYQGLILSCTYPDAASPGAQFFDYHLLRQYFENSERLTDGLVWNPAQWAAVEGHLLPLNAIVADEGLFKGAFDPTTACPGTTDATRYDPETNPGGVRCSVLDGMINQLGPRARSTWSVAEKRAGKGFAGSPIDNVGVQYGLEALQAGAISAEMFVDLNAKIGGLDGDMQRTGNRTAADRPALENMHRTGWMNSAGNLGDVAMISHVGPEPGAAHDARWSWSMRDRLDREQGHHDNQVIWYGLVPGIGDPGYARQALLAMDRWLAAVEEDERAVPVADKIVHNRPGDVQDRCTQASALVTPDGINVPVLGSVLEDLFGAILGPILEAAHKGLEPVLDPALRLVVDPLLNAVCGAGIVGETLRTDFDTPRGVAGQANTSDDVKCQLKPLNRGAKYGPGGFTDAQWATLQKVFPDGVCDYGKPGAGKQHTVTWLTYQDCHGKVVYGGQPLGAAPPNSGDGWNSRAFDGWQHPGKRGNLATCSVPKTSTGDSTGKPGKAGGSSSPVADGSGSSTEAAGGSTPAAADVSPLATTGTPITLLGAAAAWLLAAGLLAVRLSRRQRTAG